MYRLQILKNVVAWMILFGVMRAATLSNAQDLNSSIRAIERDSLLESYSIEELLDYREFYKKEIEDIEKNKKRLRRQGIQDAEKYLQNNPESKILDKIIMRLAELYYQEANDNYVESMQLYDRQLDEIEATAVDDQEVTEPTRNYDLSLALYQRIIDEFPHSDLYDDAIYNKAFLYEELGKSKEAVAVYQQLADEFSSSRYTPEALMRIAEYHFNPPVNDIEQAIEVYKQILAYKDSPKYDEALYRLGWCYYRLNEYPEAVAYFTLLADDVRRVKSLDPSSRFSNPALGDESIEYIGISFLDHGGAEGAVDYIKSIGGREYGVEILNKIADVYKEEKEEYHKAIETYKLLLTMYPFDEHAPAIQEKVVESYRLLQDDMMAYLARNELYDKYRPGGSWWQKQENEAVQEKTASITERALRDNINLLYQRAEDENDADLYLQAINDSRKYLKSFPTDTSAKLIHWNMALTLDTKLKDFDQAYEEYMKISDRYWNTKYQKFAAENAIALAKDAVNADTLRQLVEGGVTDSVSSEKSRLLSAITYEREELNENQQKLARAYNNYIKIYPHEPETAVILSNAGGLYYNNNLFPEALKYFNTILKHFELSQEADYAQYMVMESYFGKHDFQSTEIVARRLKNKPDVDSTLLARAKERLAASIYLSADVYADSANHLAAGNEYIRVVMEVPDAEFADLSLFNAALEYDKAKEFRRAVETYNYLIETRPDSKYMLDAMNNLAIDYGELGEFKNAALTYEKLAMTASDSVNQYDALYNSSIFFVKAEEWKDAIRINRSFVSRYPNSEDADDLFFDVATYYLKLDDLENANKLYGEYVQKFPNSPRVVETYYHRGEYFRKNNQIALAITEYNKSVDKNEEFKKNNQPANDFFAAEALFNMTMIKYNDYRKIEFMLPTASMEASKEKKKQLLKDVIDGFSRVVSYGTLRLYEATYYIGDAYEDFAETWARQEIPRVDETQKIVMLKEINQTAADLYGRAEKSYKQTVNVLQKLADKYEEDLIAADTTTYAEEDMRLKIAAEDSTVRVAQKWIDLSKVKISEVIYDIAELNLVSVNSFLEAPIPAGLDDVAEMEYRRQVLGKAVAPLIKQIVEAHARNIEEAEQWGLENQWIKLSRSKIVGTNNILSHEYHQLATKALSLYGSNAQKFMKVTEGVESEESNIDPIAISEQMANLLDFGKVFATVTFDLNVRTVETAEEKMISDPVVTTTKEKMMYNLYQYTHQCDSLATAAVMNKKKYEKLYEQMEKPEFEEAIFTFDDNAYTLTEQRNELLEIGYETATNLAIRNNGSANILIALVQSNPEQYSDLIQAEISDDVLTTDVTWLASNDYFENWTSPEFNDESWNPAFVVDDGISDNVTKPARIWHMRVDSMYAETDSVVTDTMQLYSSKTDSIVTSFADADTQGIDTMGALKEYQENLAQSANMVKVPSEKVYFRKQFFVDGLPVSADLKIKMDGNYVVYLNGEYITTGTESNDEGVSLSQFIRPQHNVLALECEDKALSGAGLQSILSIRSIPDWDNVRQKYQIEASDKNIQRNLVLDKYIIIN